MGRQTAAGSHQHDRLGTLCQAGVDHCARSWAMAIGRVSRLRCQGPVDLFEPLLRAGKDRLRVGHAVRDIIEGEVGVVDRVGV